MPFAYKRVHPYRNQIQASNANSSSSSSSPSENLSYDLEHPVATATEASLAAHVTKTQYLHYEKNRAVRVLESMK